MAAQPAPGLPARYRDVSELGRGAFGLVYRAVDAEGRAAAVKVLAPALATQPGASWQFAGELRKLSRLDHPAFPAALDEGRTDAGLPYYAMALVDAPDLPPGPLPADEVAAVAADLAEALAYLHGLGLVHGDLKPDNVKRGERLHLLDVGLMSLTGQAREAIAGTLEYLAPEVYRNAPVAPAADMYALGVLLYELQTGKTPFSGTPIQLVQAHLMQAPSPLAGPLATLTMALLSKDPAQRPTARGVLVALGLAEDQGPERPGLQGGGFIGRADVLAAWDALETGVLHLAAGPGLGKSRTLEECRLAAQLAGQAWVGAA
ncbi:MAG: serine/threonine protein kinase, partial [Cyanobacteria bacterium RYN_339]|nr:serine/threonine protein kinase [Cyanobacteria bacterium RYN_339]